MLTSLHIQNFLTISDLSIDFRPGFSAFTGETGAGKSILLQAVGVALGQRVSQALIRPGSSKSIVSAVFKINTALAEMLIELDLPFDETAEMICRRVIRADGSRAFINDQPVSLGVMKQIGDLCIEVHGQFDRLLEPKTHRGLLDRYAGHDVAKDAVKKAFDALAAHRQELIALEEAVKRADAEKVYILRAAEELAVLSPEEGEAETLVKDRSRLKYQGKMLQACQAAASHFDDTVFLGISGVYQELTKVASFEAEKAAPLLELLNTGESVFRDVEAGLGDIMDDLTASGAHDLSRLDDRYHALKAAARKYGVLEDALPDLWRDYEQKKSVVTQGPEALTAKHKEVEKAQDAYKACADVLTASRKKFGAQLTAEMMRAFQGLKLDDAQVVFDFTPLSPEHWGPGGQELVGLHVSFNKGMPLGPLVKVASGGERSRLMLAIRQVMASVSGIPTLIFDEIDLGVGGAVAQAMGEKMRALSRDSGLQVLSITHAPQVAALATTHYKVLKTQRDNHTETAVQRLGPTERLEEVARMLAGEVMTPQARDAAKMLMGEIPQTAPSTPKMTGQL